MGIFSCQNVLLKSNEYQLTSDQNLPIWLKSNIWGMFSTQFLALSLNLKVKMKYFQKQATLPKFHQIPKVWHRWTFLWNCYFCLQIQTQGLKLSEIHAPYVSFLSNWQTMVRCQLMSAEMDFKNTFWHEKMPMCSHVQDSYFYFENFIAYLDFQED